MTWPDLTWPDLTWLATASSSKIKDRTSHHHLCVRVHQELVVSLTKILAELLEQNRYGELWIEYKNNHYTNYGRTMLFLGHCCGFKLPIYAIALKVSYACVFVTHWETCRYVSTVPVSQRDIDTFHPDMCGVRLIERIHDVEHNQVWERCIG